MRVTTQKEGVMVTERGEALHLMAIDCCEHTIAALSTIPSARLTSIETRGDESTLEQDDDIDLIAIGVAIYPVRRLFISQIRGVYPDVPMLILRRVEGNNGAGEVIRGEFLLSDKGRQNDLEIVRAIRAVLPPEPCSHTPKDFNYNTVRNVMRIISENYAESDLDLEKVAKALPMPPTQLSRILNQQVGVSFRQLLRHTRIEEAKRLLASGRHSVKEVAVQVGFTDSHYFSRTFKALTGQSASEYRSTDVIFGG